MRTLATGIALSLVASTASAACLPILGTVQLTPDPACTVQSITGMQGFAFLPGQCFSATLKLGGLIPASGHAGVTMEGMHSLIAGGGDAASPVVTQQSRQVMTARSTFVLGGTRLYAAELIIDSGAIVTEQSIITGTDGRGIFRNASGGFTVIGNSIGQPATVRGELCT
jgi:hypothetical protein